MIQMTSINDNLNEYYICTVVLHTYKQRPHNYCQGQVTQLGIARSCLSVKIHSVIPSFIYS